MFKVNYKNIRTTSMKLAFTIQPKMKAKNVWAVTKYKAVTVI